MNKRNAVLGWATWKVGKGMMKKKAKGAVPRKAQSSSKKKPAIFAGLAALGGLAVLKRKRKAHHAEHPDQ